MPEQSADSFDVPDADEVESNEFNRYGLRRPRPRYVIPNSVLENLGEGFPAKNVIRCDNNIHLKWKRTRWHNVEPGHHDAQKRLMNAAVYRDDELLAAIVMVESRNPRHTELHPDVYFDDCDAASQSMCDHAGAVIRARRMFLDGEYYLAPREAFVEINSLFILPSAKSSLSWVEPLNRLLTKEYGRGDYSVLVLKALPLEYRHYGDSGGDTHDRLFQRRLLAATRFYRKTLGVDVIPGMQDCGVWMARSMSI